MLATINFLKIKKINEDLDAIDSDVENRSSSEFLLEDSVRSDDLSEEDVGREDVADRVRLQLLAKLDVGGQESNVDKQKIFFIHMGSKSRKCGPTCFFQNYW